MDREKRLQSVGSLIGRAAGHGVLYGNTQREAILYTNQAEDKFRRLGKLYRGEARIISSRALLVGTETLRDAFAKQKITVVSGADEALRLLPGEIERLIRALSD